MGILNYLLGSSDKNSCEASPRPNDAGAGASVDKGRTKTRAEKDLRAVQDQYDPQSGEFKPSAGDPR
jgi:hypothetical protein